MSRDADLQRALRDTEITDEELESALVRAGMCLLVVRFTGPNADNLKLLVFDQSMEKNGIAPRASWRYDVETVSPSEHRILLSPGTYCARYIGYLWKLTTITIPLSPGIEVCSRRLFRDHLVYPSLEFAHE